MKIKLRPILKKYILGILGLLSIVVIIFYGPKVLRNYIVKDKWINLINVSTIETETNKSITDTTLYLNRLYFADKISFNNTNSEDILPISYNVTKYTKNVHVENTSKIMRLKIGIKYPSCFILRINNKIVLYSPNLLYDNQNKSLYVVANHPAQDDKSVEYFYLPYNNLFMKGMNKMEIELFSKDSLPDNYNPYLLIDANIKGFSLKDLPHIKRNRKIKYITSNLPILSINTLGNKIINEHKIKATLSIKTNQQIISTDIKIEYRGQSSQRYNQLLKSYSFNTYNKKWKKKDQSLLNLPEGSEWVLYAPYMDKSLIRNAIAYHLSQEMGQYTPRFKYCDLYINEEYLGIYMLIEKPGISKNRINYYPKSKKGSAFFCEIDRPDSKKYGWPLVDNKNGYTHLNINYPKLKDIDTLQTKDLKSFISNLQNAFNENKLNYKKIDTLIDINSFINFLIINELAKNLDAYRLSCFFTKVPDKPIIMGPVWDFDLAFGNTYLGSFYQTKGWCDNNEKISSFQMLNWAETLLNDSVYSKRISEKWFFYRNSILSNNNVLTFIDSLTNYIKDSQINFHNSISILNEWVWPNTYVGNTYENEIYYLRCWIIRRMFWIDRELSKFKFGKI